MILVALMSLMMTDFDSFDDYNIKKEKRKKGDTFEMDFIDLD